MTYSSTGKKTPRLGTTGRISCRGSIAVSSMESHRYYMTYSSTGKKTPRLGATGRISCRGRIAVSSMEQGYMPRLSRDWERRAQSRRAAELLLAQADVGDLSKQVELALFYDAKLDGAATT